MMQLPGTTVGVYDGLQTPAYAAYAAYADAGVLYQAPEPPHRPPYVDLISGPTYTEPLPWEPVYNRAFNPAARDAEGGQEAGQPFYDQGTMIQEHEDGNGQEPTYTLATDTYLSVNGGD